MQKCSMQLRINIVTTLIMHMWLNFNAKFTMHSAINLDAKFVMQKFAMQLRINIMTTLMMMAHTPSSLRGQLQTCRGQDWRGSIFRLHDETGGDSMPPRSVEEKTGYTSDCYCYIDGIF